jgi:hypothetical protein
MPKVTKPTDSDGNVPLFVELPHGFFTASGTWFHITRPALEEYAGDVLEAEGLGRLVGDAEHWLRSSATISLWLFIASVFFVPGWQALLGSVVWFGGWSVLGPGFVNRPMTRLLRFLEPVPLQGLAYIGALSWLATGGRLAAVATGLVWFALVRWGLVARAVEPLVGRLQARLYGLAVPDQVLRAVIIRAALAHRLGVPQVDAMERRMMEIARGRPSKSQRDRDSYP